MDAQWQSILKAHLQDQQLAESLAQACSKAAASAPAADGDEPKPAVGAVTACLEKACVDNEQLSAEQIAQLHLISDVFRTANGDINLAKDLLDSSSSDLAITTTARVIYTYYSKAGQSSDKAVRVNLYAKEPTAVIAGLIQSGQVWVSDAQGEQGAAHEASSSSEIQLLVARFFQALVEQGLDISKNSIADFDAQAAAGNQSSPLCTARAKDVLATIQRLRAVVKDPVDIPALLDRGFASAQSIASVARADFVRTVVTTSTPDITPLATADAIAVWLRSGMVNLRNERAWADLVRQRMEVPVLAFDQGEELDLSNDALVNFANLFKENDSLQCDELESVLGPAAYLVDLLQLLRYSYFEPNHTADPNTPSELLTTLLKRRPDLVKLPLSKDNTTALVSYDDLVNEILESYLCKASQLPSHDNETPTFRGTDWKLYEDVIQHQVYPVKHFPFNLAHEALRQYLQALGSSLYELYRLFDPKLPPENGFIPLEAPSKETLSYRKSLLQTASDRRLAAEYLNISHESFVAITGEAFQSAALVAELQDYRGVFSQESYANAIGLVTTGEYWGYTSDDQGSADHKMIGVCPGWDGLRNIKQDLLPRSGLAFAELLEVLKTEFIAKRFAITVENRRGKYSGKLEDMELRNPVFTEQALGEVLTVDSCRWLLSFIRLWRVLGWPLGDIDSALVTLSDSRLAGSPMTQDFVIDPEMIINLAAVKRLSELSAVEVRRLLPLWNLMRVDGPDPIYKQLFCQPKLLARYPGLNMDVYQDKQDQKPLKIFELMAPLLSALEISPSEFPPLAEITSVTEQSDWTIENVSSLYRHALLCNILDISTDRFPAWASLNSDLLDPFTNPTDTLKATERWIGLKAKGWSVDLLFELANTHGSSSSNEVDNSDGIDLAGQIINALTDFESKYADAIDNKPSFTAEKLVEMCNQWFDLSVAADVAAMAEGSWTTSRQCSAPVSIAKDNALAAKVSIEKNTVRVYGVLDSAEKESLKNLAATNKEWVVVVDELYNEAKRPYDQLALRVPPSMMEELSYFMNPVNHKSDPLNAEGDHLLRRCGFAKTILKLVGAKATGASIQSLVAAKRSKISSQVLETLLNDRSMESSLLSTLQAILGLNRTALQGSLSGVIEGYLMAPLTDEYTFSANDGVEYTLVVDGKTHESATIHTESIKLAQGQSYFFRITKSQGALENIQFSALSGTQFTLNSGLCFHIDVLNTVVQCLARLDIASEILKKAALSNGEQQYFKADRHVNIFNPSLQDLEQLQAYIKARDMFQKFSKKPLIDSFKLVSKAAQARNNGEDLTKSLSQITGWGASRINSVLLGWTADGSDLPIFDAEGLILLHDTLSLAQKVPVTIENLRYWCTLNLPKKTTAEYHAAKSLDSIVSIRSDAKAVKAHEACAETKRSKLVAYLMTKSKVGDTELVDEDTLFEYFLIDVEMGSRQRTSRIQQAISTVQLFIHRSLLGLEKKNNIPTTAVKRSTWDWMSKFTLWQANRKVFLYPENWIDPTLRSDKSQHFKAVEADILKSNLNKETMNSIFRKYTYTVNEVADLEIQAYFWEAGTGFQGKYHLFARTRTAPYNYYYRVLEVSGVHADAPVYSWYPWSSFEVDIPAIENDWDGQALDQPGSYLVPSIYRGRLFLFIPHITLRTQPNSPSQDSTPNDYANQKMSQNKPRQYWEMKMGWVENRNGEWSNKEISTASIKVENQTSDQATGLPSVSSFQFRVSSRSPPGSEGSDESVISAEPILVIDVLRWINSGGQSSTNGPFQQFRVGRFELRSTQMVLGSIQDNAADGQNTIPTRFSSLDHTTATTQVAKLRDELKKYGQWDPKENKNLQPLVALPLELPELNVNPEHELHWTVSYNEAQHSGASALFVQRKSASYTDSWFGIPFREQDGLFPKTVREVASVQRVTHTVAQPLMEVAIKTNDLKSLFEVLEQVPTNMRSDAFGGAGQITARELGTPYSIYNWEMGFHLVLYLMERLLSTQQFEVALELATLVFDPRADDEAVKDTKGRFIGDNQAKDKPDAATNKPLSNLDRCWKFIPFKDSKLRLAGSLKSVVEKLGPGPKTSGDIDEWLANPFDPHSIARNRPAIYMKRFIMKYIEILVAAGDVYFRQDSLEAVPLALQRYVQASQLFGNHPELLQPPTKSITKTYEDISAELNDFSSAAVDMELEFPFFVEPSERAVFASEKTYDGVLGMVRSSYFPVPANPQIAALRDLIDDRFHKIRNSLDINGNLRELPLFDPPLDPGQLVRAMAMGGMSAVLSMSVEGPMPRCRFLYLLQKAFEVCEQLRRFGKAYLPIKEKKDAEALAALRARQESVMQSMSLQMKQLQQSDASKTIEVLQQTRAAHLMRLQYYLALTGEKSDRIPRPGKAWQDIVQNISEPTKKGEIVMSAEEHMEVLKLEESKIFTGAAQVLEKVAGMLAPTPEVGTKEAPMGVGTGIRFDPGKVAEGMKYAAAVNNYLASRAKSESESAIRKGRFVRQLQERRLEANRAGHDVSIVDKQIENQLAKIAVCEASIKAQEKQIAHAKEVEEYLHTKYTNESLYAWMDAALREVLYQTYLLAIDAAKGAEKAFNFEQGQNGASKSYISGSYWDDARDGAFAAHSLYLDLKRLENAWQTQKTHDFEITKNISLKQLDPWALLCLQENGKAEFSVPEVFLDFDFPGHYCRRIHSVALTITGDTVPDTDICSTLQLLDHAYRLKAQHTGLAYYSEGAVDSDPRYHADKIPILSIAFSSGKQDNGAFKLDFTSNERYGPFEGAGAVSRWSLELPTTVRTFDYASIDDVVIHMKYTSLSGGVLWKTLASNAVTEFQASKTAQLHTAQFDLRKVFQQSSEPTKAVIQNLRKQLPFWTCNKTVAIRQCWLVGSAGVGLHGDNVSEEDMPVINGKATVDSRSQDANENANIVDAIAAMNESVEIVETLADESRTGMPGKDITVEIKKLNLDSSGTDFEEPTESRLWLLIQYSVK